ncbi:MAG: STAS domain-containing protein [Terriglobia bacterium]|jgi:anti-sigma B factor antagonist
MGLTIVEKQVSGVTVLQLSGRITLGEESSQLRTKIKDVLGQGKARLVLDLGEVTYIDSAGLGTLVAGFTSAQNQGANMKLANLTKRFDEQLHITKLVTVFDCYKNLEDALKSFAAP